MQRPSHRRSLVCLVLSLVGLGLGPMTFAADADPSAGGETARDAAASADGAATAVSRSPSPANADGGPVGTAGAKDERVSEAGTVAAAANAPSFFERLTVLGGADNLVETPGSAHIITNADLERQGNTDLHRILRQVPGINIQEEDGYGLRPNIGMRGTGVERSQKITLLEDGVLIAPAPYAAPAAYYVPTAARMSGFEILKGASSVRQGPFTTGGVINMLSTDYPVDWGGRIEAGYGTDSTANLRALVGETGERVSWLLETFQFTTDGFKELDGGGDTGTELSDYMGKLRFNSRPDAGVYQALDLKLGRTDQLGDETYLGLTEDDFRADPLRRYVSSAEDSIDTEHEQVQVRYFVQPTDSIDITATVYRNDFFRNWHKLDRVAGVPIANVLSQPDIFSQALAIARGELDSAPGAIAIRNNRRDYYSNGVETVLGLHLGSETRHELELGIRFHEDEEDRFQEDDAWQMIDGRLVFNALGAPGSESNRISSGEAVAFFVQDRISFGRWVLRPGVRFETIDFLREDFGRADPDRTGASLALAENGVDAWVPGFGVDYLIDDRTSVFAGVHRGFAPPGPGADQETDPEESVNYEVGFRHAAGAVHYDAVAFYNDYDNLLGRDTLSSGGAGTGELFNGGAVESHGVELGFGYDFARGLDTSWSVPFRTAYTWTRAEFQTSFNTSFEDWAPHVDAGDELPYLPEHQLFASVGVVAERWEAHLAATYVDVMRTTAGQGPIPAGEGTDAHVVFDLSTRVPILDVLSLELKIRNLTDEVYAAARRPAGVRPGLPRTALVGFDWRF